MHGRSRDGQHPRPPGIDAADDIMAMLVTEALARQFKKRPRPSHAFRSSSCHYCGCGCGAAPAPAPGSWGRRRSWQSRSLRAGIAPTVILGSAVTAPRIAGVVPFSSWRPAGNRRPIGQHGDEARPKSCQVMGSARPRVRLASHGSGRRRAGRSITAEAISRPKAPSRSSAAT